MTSDDEKWLADALSGRVGLGTPHAPEPFDGGLGWPTDGYDGYLHESKWDEQGTFAQSGHSREAWMMLAAAMIERWTKFRYTLSNMADD